MKTIPLALSECEYKAVAAVAAECELTIEEFLWAALDTRMESSEDSELEAAELRAVHQRFYRCMEPPWAIEGNVPLDKVRPASQTAA